MNTQPLASRIRAVFRRAMWASWILVASLTLCALSCSGNRARLILLVIVDTLRADRLACYGYEKVETPHIDALAEAGVVYDAAITAVPITLPSITTILTGAYPTQHGVRGNGPYQLSEEWTTLAEGMQAAGYKTAAFVSAAVLEKAHNLTQGFDSYDDDVSAPYVPYETEMVPLADRFQNIERRAELTVDRALQWVGAQPSEDTFLMVHLFDPHVPRDPPPPFNEAYAGRPYDGEVAYVDQQIGRLLAGVRAHWRPSEITTLFVADHGEGLGTHEEILHGELLYEETIRVPLIVHGKGVPSPARIDEAVRTVDVLPTLLALAGAHPVPWSVGSALPGLSYPTPPPTAPFVQFAYSETFAPRLSKQWCELRSLRTTRWKLVDGPSYELYDMQWDRKESADVAAKYPAVCDSLSQLLDDIAFWSVKRGHHFGKSLKLSQTQIDKLESLGYLTSKTAPSVSSDSLAVWYFPPAERGKNLGLPHPRERVVDSFRRVVSKSHFEVAQNALTEGNYEEAARNFMMAIQQRPDYIEAYVGIAEAARLAGSPQAAVRHLQAARRHLPPDPMLAGMLAEAFGRAGRHDLALAVIDDAVKAGYADSALVARRRALQDASH